MPLRRRFDKRRFKRGLPLHVMTNVVNARLNDLVVEGMALRLESKVQGKAKRLLAWCMFDLSLPVVPGSQILNEHPYKAEMKAKLNGQPLPNGDAHNVGDHGEIV